MNSSYGKSNNKTSSTDAFDFDLGLGSGRSRPLNGQKSQPSSYTQPKPNPTSSWTHQPNKPAWTHQPAAPVQPSGSGSLSGPTSMVGDIFGKSWSSSGSSSSSVPGIGIGIVNNKNPNLFGDLLGSAIGPNKSSSNAPLKSSTPVASHAPFQMGSVSNSLPRTSNSGTDGKTRVPNVSNVSGNYNRSTSLGGGNVNLGGNSTRNPSLGVPSLGVPSMKPMGGGGGLGSNKDPFGSLLDFESKPSVGMNSASKPSANTGLGNNSQHNTSKTSNNDPLGDFLFPTSFSENLTQPPKQADDIGLFFSSSDGFTSQKVSEDDGWGVNSEFVEGNETTTELEGLPPPPAGVSASSAKNKGMDNYKQGQFADAIKWLSWAVVLLEKAGDDDGTKEVLSSRASCYKEVGEYKKAVADCTKVLEQDGKNVAVLVQRALLYESMEKYKLGAEDLRTVMNIDPGNRVARSTVHRLTKMASG